jgi:hypothetical protein
MTLAAFFITLTPDFSPLNYFFFTNKTLLSSYS